MEFLFDLFLLGMLIYAVEWIFNAVKAVLPYAVLIFVVYLLYKVVLSIPNSARRRKHFANKKENVSKPHTQRGTYTENAVSAYLECVENTTPNAIDEDIEEHNINISEDNPVPEPQIENEAKCDSPVEEKDVNEKIESNETQEETKEEIHEENIGEKEEHKEENQKEREVKKEYKFPPVSLLAKGKCRVGGTTEKELRETAALLQQTLENFGVRVTITDIDQGSSFTRYEMQPQQGVRVSKIVGLANDIKLNLAATDIRIEAPIPGKAAVGIDIPNKENAVVCFRDLVESKEFKEFPSNLAFAVGKDVSGQIVLTDISKMPHLLIAGETGSGKSVCIDTIIMSILYKAHPDNVKMILIDPKIVNLNIYNGIPHLLIPVVTDPKKAVSALHWGVAEMTDRYKKFGYFYVRDLKGYNKKVESMRETGDPETQRKLPEILIIVNELTDLMLTYPAEIEENICKLAQMGRSAGIHLIVSTRSTNSNILTNNIKRDIPSKMVFKLPTARDSRNVIGEYGAEHLFGKGDLMLYPWLYPKPIRAQGAFISEREVADVVDFLINQSIGNVYSDDVEEQIKKMDIGSGGNFDSEFDPLFVDAGRYVIERDKAYIGMLQRVFKIGFNRAARILDQLCDFGVVGEEEGTKPRKILMTAEEFEQLVEEWIK